MANCEVDDSWDSSRSAAPKGASTALVPIARPDLVELPQSDLRCAAEYQREQPMDGEGLVGWVVCFDGVVVCGCVGVLVCWCVSAWVRGCRESLRVSIRMCF